MQKERLLKLADLLDADAKNKNGIQFDLSWFAKPADTKNPKVDCSTKACAVGLACLSGAFKDEGLSWTIDTGRREPIPSFKDVRGIDAAKAFFGVKENAFNFLFMPGRYPEGDTGAKAERAVAKRIRDFVAGNAAP